MIPKHLLETTVQIAFDEPTINEPSWWIKAGLIPNFSFEFTDKKYGETEKERIEFWSEVIINKNYQLFMEKFPEKQEIKVDNQIFII